MTNGDITALADSDGGNGVFHYGIGMARPTDTYQASSYWVSPILTKYETLGGDPTTSNIASDSLPVTVGVRFKSAIAGNVRGVEFYRREDAGSATTVGLWDASGNLLASGTPASGSSTGPGWVRIMFASPASIAANTTYTAGYYSAIGDYNYTHNAYDSAVTVDDITALADSDGGNGVYHYGWGMATAINPAATGSHQSWSPKKIKLTLCL